MCVHHLQQLRIVRCQGPNESLGKGLLVHVKPHTRVVFDDQGEGLWVGQAHPGQAHVGPNLGVRDVHKGLPIFVVTERVGALFEEVVEDVQVPPAGGHVEGREEALVCAARVGPLFDQVLDDEQATVEDGRV